MSLNVNQDTHRVLMEGGLTPTAAALLASDTIHHSWVAKTGNLGVANNVNPPGVALMYDGKINYIRARVGTAPATTAVNLRINQLNAGTVASANGYVPSTSMGNITYPQLVTTPPGSGARIVTCTRSTVGTADTPGTVLVTGIDITGAAQTETLTPGADTVLVSGTKFFARVDTMVGSGWTIAQTADTIVFGWGAQMVIALPVIAAAATSGVWTTAWPIVVTTGDVFTVDVTQIGTGTVGADLAIDING